MVTKLMWPIPLDRRATSLRTACLSGNVSYGHFRRMFVEDMFVSHPFGELISQHLGRRRGLTQKSLAYGIRQDPAIISRMCNGERLHGHQARERVILIIRWLHNQGLLTNLGEANALLKAAGMDDVRPGEREPDLVTLLPDPRDTLPPAPRNNAPSPPNHFVGRITDLVTLKDQLGVGDCHERTPPIQVMSSIHGLPGVGKTAIAVVLANDLEISRTFSDGVAWVSLGPKPNVLAELVGCGRFLGINLSRTGSIDEASERLTRELRSMRILLVVDDVYEVDHGRPFRVVGPRGAILMTTRFPLVAQGLAPTHVYRLDVLSDVESLELLQEFAHDAVQHNPEASLALIRQLEGLPLAIQVAGRMLANQWQYGLGVEELVVEIRNGIKILEEQAPHEVAAWSGEASLSVAALLRKSTDLLDKNTRDRFVYLGAFVSQPATFDLRAMRAVWDTHDPLPTVRQLVDRGLLQAIDQGRYQMHALLTKHARMLLGSE